MPNHLTHEERTFFSLVHQAVLANPFSEERIRIDARIGGLFPETERYERIGRAISRVREKVVVLEKENRAGLDGYAEEDRQLLRSTLMFELFHRLVPRMDAHIQKQVEAGERPVPVSFAKEGIAWLVDKDFSEAEALQLFALCYQLRRAFYFIDTTLVGRSRCMKKLRESLWNNVFTNSLKVYENHLIGRMEDFSTLILGETGTGKGTAAQCIGKSGFIPFDPDKNTFSESFVHAFVSLNLSEFSENLIESELFGHKKGAFTGAVEDHKGVFHRCSAYGAIFLDEIGDVDIPVQIKLLKVLEERSFTPVGSHTQERFSGRIIAATNRSVSTLVGENGLREDFYYRLCSDLILVPPLRDRILEYPAELDDLISHSLIRILGETSSSMEAWVKEIILRDLGKGYEWPGNVRELSQCIRRILLNHACSPVKPGTEETGVSTLAGQVDRGKIPVKELISGYCRQVYEKTGTFGETARITGLDRRTVKKYVEGK